MTDEERSAYRGLKEQGAVLLRPSNKQYMVVVSTNLPNFTVTIPIRIPVTTAKYQSPKSFIPPYYSGPNIRRKQVELCVENSITANLNGVMIFRLNQAYSSQRLQFGRLYA